MGPVGFEAVRELAHIEPIGTDHRGMRPLTPRMLERQAPVGAIPVEDRVGLFVRACAKDGEGPIRCTIGRDFRVEGFVPHSVGTEPDHLLAKTANQDRRVRSHGHARGGERESPCWRCVVDVRHRRIVVDRQSIRKVGALSLEVIGVAKVHVVDSGVVGDAVVGPLREGAEVLGDPAGIEEASLLQHDTVVPREVTGIGTWRAVGIGERRLHHSGEWQLRRECVVSHRQPRQPGTLSLYLLYERVAAELEFGDLRSSAPAS